MALAESVRRWPFPSLIGRLSGEQRRRTEGMRRDCDPGPLAGVGSATARTLVELGAEVVAADLPGTDFGPQSFMGAPDAASTLRR